MSNLFWLLMLPVLLVLGYLAGSVVLVSLNVREVIQDTSYTVKTQPAKSQELTGTIVLDTCWDCRVQGTLPSWALNQQAYQVGNYISW